MHLRHATRFLAAVMAAALVLPGFGADSPSATTSQVEAAYLLNFGKFFKSAAPQQQTGDFEICVLGDDPTFERVLAATVSGETIEGRPVSSRHASSAEDALHCELVFLSKSERGRVWPDLAILGSAPVLTVSDIPDFAVHGGMIEFVPEDNRIRFVVNLNACRKSGLTPSSQLLKVAVKVIGNGGGGGGGQ
jgi:hypothetical protein